MNEVLRPADERDLASIRAWLELEERDGEGFIHNWSLIEAAAAEQEMMVLSGADGLVGFLTYGLTLGSILQVRSDHKRRGIGRQLVEHAIRKANAVGNPILVIQCEPKSSIPFWRRMGFVPHRERDHGGPYDSVYMHRVSAMEHAEVCGDDLHRVVIRTYPEWKLYRDGEEVIPDRVYYAAARLEGDRILRLDHRVCVVHEPALRDPVVEIEVWGRAWFLDKVKRDAANKMGFQATSNGCGWYADILRLPDEPPD